MLAGVRWWPVVAILALAAFPAAAEPPVHTASPGLELHTPTAGLSEEQQARTRAVVSANAALLGARDIEFCKVDDAACLAAVRAAPRTHIETPPMIVSAEAAPTAGREWPPGVAPLRAQRVVAEVHFSRAGHRARREVPLLAFALATDKGELACVFPMEHWEWSDMHLPDRFAMAPLGICGQRQLSVAGLWAQDREDTKNTEDTKGQPGPDAAPWAIRFLSETEAELWESGDLDALHNDSGWNPAHPFAKYFFLESLRWWRAGGTEPRAAQAAAIRLPRVPIGELRELSRKGDAFLDIYDDGEQIELTIVTRAGLQRALAWPWESLRDRAAAGATAPEFETVARSETASRLP